MIFEGAGIIDGAIAGFGEGAFELLLFVVTAGGGRRGRVLGRRGECEGGGEQENSHGAGFSSCAAGLRKTSASWRARSRAMFM